VSLAAFLIGPLAVAAPLADDALVDQGRSQLERGDLDGALATFARAEQAAPKDPRPPFFRGAALAFRKDVRGATRAYLEAIRRDPGFADAHLELGTIYLDQRRLDDARVEFKAAVAARPGLHEAWYDLSLVEREQRRWDAALVALQKAAALQPSVEIAVELAELQRTRGDLGACEAGLRADAARFPRSLRLRIELVHTLAAEKKCGAANDELAGLPSAHAAVKSAAQAVRAACPRR
jgi:tetratricopeptide (TPR) repeat protein